MQMYLKRLYFFQNHSHIRRKKKKDFEVLFTNAVYNIKNQLNKPKSLFVKDMVFLKQKLQKGFYTYKYFFLYLYWYFCNFRQKFTF